MICSKCQALATFVFFEPFWYSISILTAFSFLALRAIWQADSLFVSIRWISIPPASSSHLRQLLEPVSAHSMAPVNRQLLPALAQVSYYSGKNWKQALVKYLRHLTALTLQQRWTKVYSLPQRPTSELRFTTYLLISSLSQQSQSSYMRY